MKRADHVVVRTLPERRRVYRGNLLIEIEDDVNLALAPNVGFHEEISGEVADS